MKIRELIFDEEYVECEADRDAEISKIVTDPLATEAGSLLIIPNISRLTSPIKFETPPIAVICDHTKNIPPEVPRIIPKNPRAAVANAFHRFYHLNEPRLKTIAITGTNGKTSTAHFVKAILEYTGNKVGYIGTGAIEIGNLRLNEENYSMTTPDPEILYKVLRRMDDEGCRFAVMEVSSHALALDKVAPLYFDYGIFTNLSSEHGDFHKTLDDYFDAKCKLFSKCRTAVFNIDDPYARRALEISKAKKNITVGVLQGGDIYLTNVENKGDKGTSYLYRTKNFMFRMNVSIPGIYNVYNSMLAAAVCIDIGYPPYMVKEAIGNLASIPGRFEIIKGDVTVIIDFAHTEVALECFLRDAKRISENRKLTVVFGCGGERDKEKRPKMASIAERYADKIFVTTDNSRSECPTKIICDITKGFTKSNYKINYDRKAAITEAILSASKGDVIAIIGKGAEKYIIDKNGYHAFDEKEIVAKALEKRKARVKCESN